MPQRRDPGGRRVRQEGEGGQRPTIEIPLEAHRDGLERKIKNHRKVLKLLPTKEPEFAQSIRVSIIGQNASHCEQDVLRSACTVATTICFGGTLDDPPVTMWRNGPAP